VNGTQKSQNRHGVDRQPHKGQVAQVGILREQDRNAQTIEGNQSPKAQNSHQRHLPLQVIACGHGLGSSSVGGAKICHDREIHVIAKPTTHNT
jgi:hypothetical protein